LGGTEEPKMLNKRIKARVKSCRKVMIGIARDKREVMIGKRATKLAKLSGASELHEWF
jgi:hypothetical protein